jgi:hypothetical protein
MSLLQYTSKEMFSSTELVRKSKNIFDKLNKKEIEKAIILRDGKPGIILLDFNEYERIISEYINLKDKNKNHSLTEKVETKKEEIIEKKESEKDDYKSTIDELEKLEFELDYKSNKEKEEPLKEFWD